MWRDLRYTIQGLRRSPIFTVAATLALGIAIGANATIFGLIDGLWFRPPGVIDPGRLTWIFSTTPAEQQGAWSWPEYLELRDNTSAFEGVVARGGRGSLVLAPDGTQDLALVNVVSLNFFTTLGVRAEAGRLFAPGDSTALSAQPGIVLGHAYWRRRFGGDPAIVGQTIRLGGRAPLPVTVLGVLPSSFRDLDAAADRDLWLPPQTWLALTSPREFEDPEARWFLVVARRSAPMATARSEVAALVQGMAAEHPGAGTARGARLISDLDHRVESGGMSAVALLGLVLLVVLITCVNVANLLLARAAARTRELAVRLAIGASRVRLVRQLMTESVVLGVLGAFVGFILATWLIRLLPAILGAPPGFRSFAQFHTDGRVLVFTVAVTMLTTMLFGVVPGWFASRADLHTLTRTAAGALKPETATGLLARAQIAVSLVLLCGAALLARSFAETRRADLGVTRQPVLTAWVTNQIPSAIQPEALARLESLPGAERAALAFRAPLSLSGGGIARPVRLPGRALPPADVPEIKFNAVSASYFDVMGTRLLRGRTFTASDGTASERVVVVNEQFARQFFPGGDALDARVVIGDPDSQPYRVVGIVQNAVVNEIGEAAEPYFYLPYGQSGWGEGTFLVRASTDAAALVPSVREALKRLDARLEPQRLITMGQYIDYSASPYRATAWLALTLAGTGLVLTVLGIYGVVAYRTTRRNREIGIRMALGAQRGEVLSLVLRQAGRIALVGLAIGIPSALAASRLMASMLFGIEPWDIVAFAAAAVLLLASVCAAAAVPAWRATRVSPAIVLRE